MDTALRDQLQSALRDNYAIERELGRGGMGAVFLARDRALDRLVAIKVLPPELALQPTLRERFLRETRTAAAFSHPNIVPVHAVEERDAMLLFVMGFVEGETLTQRVARAGPLSAAEAVRLLQETAWALSYAHGRGVVHRDVKPDNILIERATGRALVMDFGIARSTAATGLTTLGEVMGTPHFMSPEQAAGESLDGRSDLYSLGVTAFFALTGRLPFEADSAQAVLAMHLTRPAPRVAELRPDLPVALTDAVDRCLAKDPADRFATGEALVAALEAVRAARPEIAPPMRLFLQRAEHVTRSVVILLLLVPMLTSRLASGDAAVMTIFVLAMAAWMLRSVVEGARELVRLGFRYDDFRDATLAIAEERRDVRRQLLASPDARRRRRRATRFRLGAVAAGAAMIAATFAFTRTPLGHGLYRSSIVGFALAIAGVCAIAYAFVATVTDPARTTRFGRLQLGFWTGWRGRFLFRMAARGVRAPRPAGRPGAPATGAATPSPRHLLASLPRPLRAELSDVRRQLEEIDGAIDALRDRAAALDGALTESRDTPPAALVTGGSRLADRRHALLDDLARARRDTELAEADLLAARDNIRLQLLRARTGLASASDVRGEVARALALARAPAQGSGVRRQDSGEAARGP